LLALSLGSLLPRESGAYIFQPPISSGEIALAFGDVQATVLDGMSQIFSAFSSAEDGEVPLSNVEALVEARDQLEAGIIGFQELPEEALSEIPVRIELGLEATGIVPSSEAIFVTLAGMSDARDLADFLENQALGILNEVDDLLADEEFSPEAPLSVFARQSISDIAIRISVYIEVANLAATSMAVEGAQ
jgi:hypothetical protein